MKSKEKCSARYCRKPASPTSKLCYRCTMRKYKAEHPLEYTFNVLRTNAKRRGKSFELTKEEFAQFCEQTGYLSSKGTTKAKMHIDRIDATKGYSINNIQILSCSANSSKGAYERNQPF